MIEHVQISADEAGLLANHIEEVIRQADSDHQARITRFRRFWSMWRMEREKKRVGEEHVTTFRPPVLNWATAAKHAQLVGAILGEDAECSVQPRGATDQRDSFAVKDYLDYLVFEEMDIDDPMMEIVHRTILNGRSHAFIEFVEENVTQRHVYRGSRLVGLDPDDFIVPAERVNSLQEFSWVCHREYPTAQDLLDGERKGKFYGVTENWQRIMNLADEAGGRADLATGTQDVKDRSEGVQKQYALSNRGRLEVLNWYGRYRAPKKQGARLVDWADREMDEVDVVIRMIPKLKLIIGIQKLDDIYRDMTLKRPFADFGLSRDGSYWCMGYGHLLEYIEDEAAAAHRRFDRACDLNAAPVGFYKPLPGQAAEALVIEGGRLYPADDPERDINIVTFQGDVQAQIMAEQKVLGYGEQVVGQSAATLGRTSDRPNAPRTAYQTAALIEQGDIRGALEVSGLRKDLDRLLRHIWEFDCSFTDQQQKFFRVTEERARRWGGSVVDGRAALDPAARMGWYDFKLKFAASKQEKEAQIQRTITRVQMDLANPLILQDPVALWKVTRDYHEALGNKNFEELLPVPQGVEAPKSAKQELAMAQQRQRIFVHPQDNHELHIGEHIRDMEMLRQAQEPDTEAIATLAAHVAEHKAKAREAALMMAAVQQVADSPAVQQALVGASPDGQTQPQFGPA